MEQDFNEIADGLVSNDKNKREESLEKIKDHIQDWESKFSKIWKCLYFCMLNIK
jgi:hypothetical protein